MNRRTVSVVIPARDAARTIARAVLSVQAPDEIPDEIIVVDDGSGDDTAALARNLGARVIRLAASQGAAAARNAGIMAATGNIIAFQDADDEWLPGKLARQMALLCAAPDAVFIACGARLYAETGEDLGALYDGQIPDAGAAAWRGLLARNTIATPTVVVWRHHLLAAGGFDAGLEVAEDQDMWIRLALRGRLLYLDEQLVRVHRTPISVSGVGTRLGYRQQLQVTLPMIERHIAANRHRLTRREVAHILGGRIARIGRAAYWHGAYADGLRLILRAIWLGDRPVANLRFLVTALPAARWLKTRALPSTRQRP
jgi:glycosyltransferase involved in cell wall biosynthesis